MPEYFVQKFTIGNTKLTCYAKNNEHNHDKGNDFTKDVRAILMAEYGVNSDAIELGPFMSKQPEPKNGGREFKWNGENWVEK